MVGILAGGVLGLIDGLSAWFYPEARLMMVPIIVGSTLKGLLTGLSAGLVAKWKQSLILGVAAGAFVGFVLSSIVAVGQRANYWEIVMPGMLVGVISGMICQRWRVAIAAACCLLSLSSVTSASQSSGAPARQRTTPVDIPHVLR